MRIDPETGYAIPRNLKTDRFEIAWLLWSMQAGYMTPEDRDGLWNWMRDPEDTLTEDDISQRNACLEIADHVIKIVREDYHGGNQPVADEFLEKARSFSEEDGYSFIYDSRHHHMKLAKLPDWDEHPVYVPPNLQTMADKLFHEFVSGIDWKISSTWLKSIVETLDER